VSESAEDLIPADPVFGEVDRFGPPGMMAHHAAVAELSLVTARSMAATKLQAVS
jgi:hypothetical protein